MNAREIAALIRKGAALRPQCKSRLFRDGGSCAIGAICEASGVKYVEQAQFSIVPDLLYRELRALGNWVFDEIWKRNDNGQTREQIADWLDSLEPAQRQTFDSFMAATLKAVEVPMDSESPITEAHK